MVLSFFFVFVSRGLRRENISIDGTVALISIWHSDSLLLPDAFMGEAVLPLNTIRKKYGITAGLANGKWLTLKMPDPCDQQLAVNKLTVLLLVVSYSIGLFFFNPFIKFRVAGSDVVIVFII